MVDSAAVGATGEPFVIDLEAGKIREFAPDRGGDVNPPQPLVVGPLTRTDLVRYQGASGDFNPIHHDETFAKAAGLPAPLSLGMLQAGLMAAWATNWLGTSSVRRFNVRFAAQVFPGDTVSCSGTVEREYEVDGAPMVDLALFCHTQDGTLADKGWATFEVVS